MEATLNRRTFAKAAALGLGAAALPVLRAQAAKKALPRGSSWLRIICETPWAGRRLLAAARAKGLQNELNLF